MVPKYQMTREDSLFVARKYIKDNIYKSMKMEGVGITFPETVSILEGYVPGGMRVEDVYSVVNLKRAWMLILEELDTPMSLSFIKEINHQVGRDIYRKAGGFRDFPVRITGTTYQPPLPDFSKASEEILQILQCSNGTECALRLMFYLMRAQLFSDGNKRTAMLVANQMLLSEGLGYVSVEETDVKDFLELLISFYEDNDPEKIMSFTYERALHGLDILSE